MQGTIICEEEKFSGQHMSELLSNPEISSKQGLTQILKTIGRQMYFTTFTDDSGSVEDGIKLSLLQDYPSEITAICLRHINKKGNYIVEGYVEEYLRNHPNPFF